MLVTMNNKPALIFTIVFAVIAVATVVLTVVLLTSEDQNGGGSVTTPAYTGDYAPDEDFKNEILDSVAPRLIRDNYKVLQLFYTVGMSHKPEPYDNIPEDGYYTAVSSEFSTAEELFELVERTFSKETAQRIITNPLGEGAVYSNRKIGNEKGLLGINMDFTPMDYDLIWEDPEIRVDFISEEACIITITLKTLTGVVEVKSMHLDKYEDGLWRLENIII